MVKSLNDEELTISTEVELGYRRKSQHQITVPIPDVMSLEVSRGRNFRWKRVWIGAAIGLIGGAAIGALDAQSFSGGTTSESIQTSAFLGLGIGAATGATPWEQWNQVWPPP